MPDDDAWRNAQQILKQALHDLDEQLARAGKSGEGLDVKLSPKEVIALRLAIANGIDFYFVNACRVWAEEELKPYRRAKLVMERDPEKDHGMRAKKAVAEAGWSRQALDVRNRRMAIIYRHLVNPFEGQSKRGYLYTDHEGLVAGYDAAIVHYTSVDMFINDYDPSTIRHHFEGLPYKPREALRVVARLFRLGEARTWEILRDERRVGRKRGLFFTAAKEQ